MIILYIWNKQKYKSLFLNHILYIYFKENKFAIEKCLRKRKQMPVYHFEYSFEIFIINFEYLMHQHIDLSGIQLYILINFKTEIVS